MAREFGRPHSETAMANRDLIPVVLPRADPCGGGTGYSVVARDCGERRGDRRLFIRRTDRRAADPQE